MRKIERRSFQKYLEQRFNKNEIEKIEKQAKFEKMIMKTKLIKHDNDLALIIDESLLDQLKFDENTELEISIKDECLIVTDKKKSRALRDAEIDKIAKEVIKKYKPVLDKLAKT